MKNSDAVKVLSKIISPNYNDNSLKNTISKLTSNDWEEIIKIANKQQVVPSIWINLNKKNLIELINDKQLLNYTKEIYELNSFRNKNILKQVSEICEFFAQENIDTILLKGVSALAQKHYDNIGERVMLDIDILVDKDNIFKAINLLKTQGYKEISENKLSYDWHHYNRLYHPDKMTSVELHRHPLSDNRFFPYKLDKTTHLTKCKTIKNAYILKPEYELIHSFLHTQISHYYHRRYILPLRHMHHFSTMLKHYKNIDYTLINNYIKSQNLTTIWSEYIYLNNKLFKIDIDKFYIDKKQSAKYSEKIFYFIDNPRAVSYKINIIQNKLINTFSYKTIKKLYGVKSKTQWIIYMPFQFIMAIKKFINQESRNRFLNELKQ